MQKKNALSKSVNELLGTWRAHISFPLVEEARSWTISLHKRNKKV
jgi:hypothetical protein